MLTGPEAIAQLAGGKVLPIYLEGRVVPVQNDISRELGLSANQVVRAVVEQRPEGLIILINGRPVELPVQLRFRPGDLIWLKVVQTPQGLVLQTVAPRLVRRARPRRRVSHCPLERLPPSPHQRCRRWWPASLLSLPISTAS